MSRGINKVFLMGNVGSDPEVRTSGSGVMVAKVSLATNRQWKKDGKEYDDVQWHRLTFFGKLAEIVEKYVAKGDRLHVEGRIEYSQSEHQGEKKYWTDIIINEMVMLGSSNGGQSQGQGQPSSRPEPSQSTSQSSPVDQGAIADDESDLPF